MNKFLIRKSLILQDSSSTQIRIDLNKKLVEHCVDLILIIFKKYKNCLEHIIKIDDCIFLYC